MKKFLVSTANVYGYDSNGNELFRGVSMLDTSIETSLSNTDVRGGQGNKLLYVYYHTAEMNITVNNAEFSLDFLALNVGSNIEIGADMFIDETVEVTNGAGSVSKTIPLAFDTTTTYGYVSLPNVDTIQKVEFAGNAFTLTGDYANYTGDVCVRYYGNEITAREVTVYADMLPANIRLVMEAKLCSSDATTNQIGTVQVIVPRASMTGAFTLSMTPDSVASTPLNVRALAYEKTQATGGCEGNKPIYAEIIEHIDNQNWYDNVKALAIEGGDITMKVGNEENLKVYAMREDGTAPFLAPVSGLTFSSEDTDTVAVNGSAITAVKEGTTSIKATITEIPEVNATIFVTVEAAE